MSFCIQLPSNDYVPQSQTRCLVLASRLFLLGHCNQSKTCARSAGGTVTSASQFAGHPNLACISGPCETAASSCPIHWPSINGQATTATTMIQLGLITPAGAWPSLRTLPPSCRACCCIVRNGRARARRRAAAPTCPPLPDGRRRVDRARPSGLLLSSSLSLGLPM